MKMRLLSTLLATPTTPAVVPAQESAIEAAPIATAPAEPSAMPQPPQTQELTHVEGPLATVYSRALDATYAVEMPQGLTVDTPGRIGVQATFESAAMDEMIAMQAHATTIERLQNLVHSGDGDSLRVYTTGVATQDQADSSVGPRAQAIFDDIANYVDPSDPINFVFVETCAKPSEDSPISASGNQEFLGTALPKDGKITASLEGKVDVAKLGELGTELDVVATSMVDGTLPGHVEMIPNGASIGVKDVVLTEPQRVEMERLRNGSVAVDLDPNCIPASLRVPMGTKADEPKLTNTEPGVYSNFAIESITVIIKTKRVA